MICVEVVLLLLHFIIHWTDLQTEKPEPFKLTAAFFIRLNLPTDSLRNRDLSHDDAVPRRVPQSLANHVQWLQAGCEQWQWQVILLFD